MLRKETLAEIKDGMNRISTALDIIGHMEYADAMNSLLELLLEVWDKPDWRPLIDACKRYLDARTDFIHRLDFGGINMNPYLLDANPCYSKVEERISKHVKSILGRHNRYIQDLIFDNYNSARIMIHQIIPSQIIAAIMEEEEKVADMEREYYSKEGVI